MTTIMYVSAILAVVIILTIIGVLSRYRRCKPNQVLVVYGKTVAPALGVIDQLPIADTLKKLKGDDKK